MSHQNIPADPLQLPITRQTDRDTSQYCDLPVPRTLSIAPPPAAHLTGLALAVVADVGARHHALGAVHTRLPVARVAGMLAEVA